MPRAKTVVRTSCNRDCPDACVILAEVSEGRVTALRGEPEHPVTQGFLCSRTSRFLERQYDPERLTTPLLRRGERLEPASWDEALDFVAERLLSIRAESGPASIFHYRSGGSLGILKALCDRFFELFGPVTTKRGDICSGAGEAAQLADFGESDSSDLHDLSNARHILLWGKNPYVSNVHLLPVLMEARRRGARLVLIDPVWHRTAGLCERHVQPRPGGDFALAMGVARALEEAGGIDDEATGYCSGLEEFAALYGRRPVRDWARAADVTEEEVRDLARRLAEKPCAIQVGWGMQRRANGSAIVRALDALGAVSGNLGISGGGVSFYFKRRGAFDFGPAHGANAEPPPRTVCEPRLGQELLELDRPPIRACWITAGNPVVMLPDSETTVRALSRLDLLVVVDSFVTDTARLAHVVLPAATMLEDEDLVGAYGNHYLGSVVPAVRPPPGVATDFEILRRLAPRVGLGAEFGGTAREWKRKLLGKIAPLGVTLERLETEAVRNPLAPVVLFADRKFPTSDGRVHLVSEEPVELSGEDGYPLYLMSLSTEKSQSSQWAGPPRRPQGPAVVRVHPEASNGLPDGSTARIESRIGWLLVRVEHDSRQRTDVAVMDKGGSRALGRCANSLVRARLTDGGEGGALYDERVRLVPV
ncbi:MAG: molybdopterin-dependent oxidoreductase [Candidatus Wallbacteria bacterium]|nr:molybdopterin-dependent oxidoreductase [Candidatus Wallbacteria bacterium]